MEDSLVIRGGRRPPLVKDRFGIENSAYAFDGLGDMIANIRDRKGDFSISLWAKADDIDKPFSFRD